MFIFPCVIDFIQFQRSHPDIYRRRFPTAESEAAVFPERPQRLKPQLMFLTLKKPFQPFQRSWSFRAWVRAQSGQFEARATMLSIIIKERCCILLGHPESK